MKRNTNSTLLVSINVDKDSIKLIEFIFKQKKDENSTALLLKKYTHDSMKTSNGQNAGEVIFYIDLTPSETMKLPPTTVYMDTRIVTNDNKVLETEIVSFDVKATLFSEVYEE